MNDKRDCLKNISNNTLHNLFIIYLYVLDKFIIYKQDLIL